MSVMSLSKKFMMLDVKINDEKTVKRTARPAGESKEETELKLIHSLSDVIFSMKPDWENGTVVLTVGLVGVY